MRDLGSADERSTKDRANAGEAVEAAPERDRYGVSKSEQSRLADRMGLAQAESVLRGESPVVIAGLIEGEIIPRLLFAHRSSVPSSPGDRISSEASQGFASQVLRLEAHALIETVDGYIARGASIEAILVDLLAPAARQLGVYWEEDLCDFVDVTMGLWRLQQVVHEISARNPRQANTGEANRRALFSVFPGAKHSFGTVVVEECFRRQGWQTDCVTSATEAFLISQVQDRMFDLIGLTLSCSSQLTLAPALISLIRTNSRNPRIAIMVGGPLISENPEIALQIGADATAADAETAVDRAELLVASLGNGMINRC